MIPSDSLTDPLDGKTPRQQLEVAAAALDAAKRGFLPLSVKEKGALARFVDLIRRAKPVDDDLLHQANRVVRHHQQHIIALTGSGR